MSVALEQKYIEDDKVIIVSLDFVYKLEKYSEFISGKILESVDKMSNEIEDDCTLGLVFNDQDGEPLFFELEFSSLNDVEVSLYDFNTISSDRYLDLLLDKNLIKP
jgi:hypothetical protein